MSFLSICRVSLLSSVVVGALAAPSSAQVHIDAQGRVSRPLEATDEAQPSAEPAIDPKTGAPATAQAQVDRQQAPVLPPPVVVQSRSIDEGGELHLICGGAGAANKPDVTTSTGSFSGSFDSFGSNGFNSGTVSGSTSGTEWGTRVQGFADEVRLSMSNRDGRLRMPRVMLPQIRGGEDGWFELSDIEIDSREIRATINVNIINHPRLRLDRQTGSISISGRAGDYVGQCERFEPAQVQQRF